MHGGGEKRAQGSLVTRKEKSFRFQASMFIELTDEFDKAYFSYDVRNNPHFFNTTHLEDFAANEDPMRTRLRLSGPFSRDLTSRDDVLLAILSLILLFTIEISVTNFLLRTRNGKVNNFGFSVKVIIELVRDFNLRRVLSGRRGYDPKKNTLHRKLVFIAACILVSTFGLEVAVLFLTEPIHRSVTNQMVTLRLLQPIPPRWEGVRFHNRASLNRPCTAIFLTSVDQGSTRVNNCITTSLLGRYIPLFEKIDGDIELQIVSDLHDFGAEHTVEIGNLSATYSSRVYFNLQDEKPRLMHRTSKPRNEEGLMGIVHNQCIAFLFSVYQRATKDASVTVKQLNDLKIESNSMPGSPVTIWNMNGKTIRSNATRYVTTVKGKLPRGERALFLAQQVFRGTHGIIVAEADQRDLFIEEGMVSKSATVWQEKVRILNWLSLTVILVTSIVFLVVCRVLLKPVTTAEIAGAFAKTTGVASISRSPVQLSETRVGKEFSIYSAESWPRIGSNYSYRSWTDGESDVS